MHRLAGLQAELGGPELWIKREDLNGFGFGGNKVAKLELLLADARHQGATCLVTVGAAQSNHARVTAVAARVAGMSAYLVLGGTPPDRLSGNLVLDDLAAAHVMYVDTKDWVVLQARMEALLGELRRHGEVPYAIPLGGSNEIGASASAYTAVEMLRQIDSPPTRIVVASGSGGTQAGLEVGLRASSVATVVSGIAVTTLDLPEVISDLANRAAGLLGVRHHWTASDVEVSSEYIGRGYGEVTEKSEEAIRLLVMTDGIFLDHVYTAKAMAALIDKIRNGLYSASERIVFWHTGGSPQLFAASAPSVAPTTMGLLEGS